MFSRNTSSNKIALNPKHSYRAFIPQFHYVTLGDFPHGIVKSASPKLKKRVVHPSLLMFNTDLRGLFVVSCSVKIS
jgi:hypothetical protein